MGTTIFSNITQLAREVGAINLGQGFPDFDGPDPIREAAIAAVRHGPNQYAVGVGQPDLRAAIAAHARRWYGQEVDPASMVTVTNGATEAIFATLMGLTEPGDEVIVLEPSYDSYAPGVIMAGATPVYVPMPAPPPGEPGWRLDVEALAAAFTPRTRAILLNTPHNPTGMVLPREVLQAIADLCIAHDVVAITDEVYEHLLYDGAHHIRLALLPGMAERTVTISSLGKTFSLTGWKIGWAIAAPALTAAVRATHQYITFSVATPLQEAAAVALSSGDHYFHDLAQTFQARRDFLAEVLTGIGMRVVRPSAGYFIMADVAGLGHDDDLAFCQWLIREAAVATIPPSVFYCEAHKHLARGWIRFAFCKKMETLEEAADRLQRVRQG